MCSSDLLSAVSSVPSLFSSESSTKAAVPSAAPLTDASRVYREGRHDERLWLRVRSRRRRADCACVKGLGVEVVVENRATRAVEEKVEVEVENVEERGSGETSRPRRQTALISPQFQAV